MMKRRDPYHHGDLRRALVDAATELARSHGPGDVILREAARRVGVSASAAYRHFADRDALLAAVASRARAAMADAMTVAVASRPPIGDPPSDAVARFRVIGLAYIRFALEEPGLFRTAFGPWPTLTEPGHLSPSTMLIAALDDLVATGAMQSSRRVGAEGAAWAAVHGISILLADGALGQVDNRGRDAVVDRTLDLVVSGLVRRRFAGTG